MSLAVEQVLREIARLGESGADLITGLRASGLNGAEAIADDLAAGKTLAEAFAGHCTPELANCLLGPRPDPTTAALLVADELESARQRRAQSLDAIAYPVTAFIAVLVIGIWAQLRLGQALPETALIISLLMAVVAVALPLAAFVAPIDRLFPMLGAWRRHAALAADWRRAGLVLRWHLEEASAASLFGPTPIALAGSVAGTATDASGVEHCDSLARWHQERSRRSLRWLLVAMALLCQLAAGYLALVMTYSLFSGLYTQVGIN